MFKNHYSLKTLIYILTTFFFITNCQAAEGVTSNNKYVRYLFPKADKYMKFKISGNTVYYAYKNKVKTGVVVTGRAYGYAGIIYVMAGVSLRGKNKGKIKKIIVTKHSETRSYFYTVNKPFFRKAFIGKTLKTLPRGVSNFKKKLGIDVVSGATISSIGILKAVRNALEIIKSL